MAQSRNNFSVAFCGSPSFVIPVAESLSLFPLITLTAVITQPDKPGNKNKTTPSPVADWAKSKKLPLLQPSSLKSPEFQKIIAGLGLDAVIVFAYGKLIPESALAIPRCGWVNIHPSLLPEYRGASPLQAAILDEKSKTGVSLMVLDKGMDSGPLIGQQEFLITENDDAETLRSESAKVAIRLLQEKLTSYLSGNIHPQLQNDSQATFTQQLTKEDGHVNWNLPAKKIIQMVKAYTPWPGVWSESVIGKISILKAVRGKPTGEILGTLLESSRQLHVACGDKTTIQILRIKREGKKEMDAASFIRGASQTLKTVLH